MTCGRCRVDQRNLAPKIIFCPLHLAAEELREAVQAQHSALDWCLATIAQLDEKFYPSRSPAWKAVVQGNAALASAEGKG